MVYSKILLIVHIFLVITYCVFRFGSVGQDTSLCLWDFTEDQVKSHLRKLGKKKEEQNSLAINEVSVANDTAGGGGGHANNAVANNNSSSADNNKHSSSSSSSLTYKLANLNFGPISGGGGKDSSGHKRAFSLPSRSEKKEANIRVGGSLTKSSVQQFQVTI